MAHDPAERFRVFISHKHDDHVLAMAVHDALEGLSPTKRIECFVSGADISAGSDWNHEIRVNLVQSHLLVLLFTRPSQNWDWCLYEAGLFTRLDLTEDRSIVSVYRSGSGSPRPLNNIQGIPAETKAVADFLMELCTETWQIAPDWRLGSLVPDISRADVEAAAKRIVRKFPQHDARPVEYYPCHQVVLDLGKIKSPPSDRIPEAAEVVEGEGATSGYTLALFNLASGSGRRTWGELLESVDGVDADWRKELDLRYQAALGQRLFEATTATMSVPGGHRQDREYRPVLYRIRREPAVADGDSGKLGPLGRPLEVTVVLDPVPDETSPRPAQPG